MKLQRVANSIVTRLVLIGVFIVVAGTALRFAVLTEFLREDIGTLAASQQLALAKYVAHDVDQKIVEREQLLRRLAKALPRELLSQPDALRAWLGEHYEMLPLFSYGMFVADLNGAPIADYPYRPERVGISYAKRDYFQSARDGFAYIGKPAIGLAAKEPILPMATPIRDRGGKVIAVLAGITTLATPGFLDLLQTSRIGESGSFLLISPRDQLFVAAGDPAMVLKPTPPAGVNLFHDRAMAGFRGTGVTVNAKGVEEISAMVSVPSAGWFVVARLPTSEAFATVARAQNFVLKYSVPVITFFVILGTFGFVHCFRPLFRAADHADRMTRGEIPLEPLPIARNDEVGYLTASFNRLLAKLSDTQIELDRMAHHDLLTGLPNRLLLSDRLQQALERARRHHSRLAVLFLDLDGFKPINDALGHEAGDEVLRQVARRLTGVVRSSDTLARVGGDEFIIVLPDITEDDARQAGSAVAEKCIEAMARPFTVRNTICPLGVSIGVVIGDGACSAHDLLLAADQAMYRAKDAGRGRYIIADNAVSPVDGNRAADTDARKA